MPINSYPSMVELLDGQEKFLNKDIVNNLTQRFEKLGTAYLTNKLHTDGRQINNVMFINVPKGAIEEVIDTIFNVLVMGLKGMNTQYMLGLLKELYIELDNIESEV